MPSTLTLIPSARRLMDSLRDIGYELPAAVADLVDNSVDADATSVDIAAQFEGEDSWIRIADNGTGMVTERLNEAMRYGTDRNYREVELGKFGLGLKTASLSQCRRFTVATRTDPYRREIEIRRWDLDHVIDSDSWELIQLSSSEVRTELIEPLRQRTGTVVMWERLDRIFDYKLPSGRAAETGLASICREIETHLSMVFHRFLSHQSRRSLPLSVTVQGNPIDAWDPFARTESATLMLDRQSIGLRHAGRTHSIIVQPYVLPNQMQFSTARAWEAASGPKRWNRQQGFYIYRGDRMIQSGGWNRLRTSDEHTKLARIAIDIPSSADAAFGINVSKMRVLIPSEIRPELRAIAGAVANRAQVAYRQTADGQGGGQSPGGRSTGGRSTGGRSMGERSSGDNASGATGNGAAAVPWAFLRQVLQRELSGQPELLERVLTALHQRAEQPTGSRSP